MVQVYACASRQSVLSALSTPPHPSLLTPRLLSYLVRRGSRERWKATKSRMATQTRGLQALIEICTSPRRLRRARTRARDHNQRTVLSSCLRSARGTIGRTRKKRTCLNGCALFFSCRFSRVVLDLFLQHIPAPGGQDSYQVPVPRSQQGSK